MRTAFPEINTTIAHLRDVLGDQTYESLACEGETMTTTAIATYAYDQIDWRRNIGFEQESAIDNEQDIDSHLTPLCLA